MRKADIVTAISEKTGLAKVDVLVSLEAFFNEVRETMGNGENVYIRGFGSFIIKRRAAKMGRNIKRNKTVQIPEHFIPAFKPAKIFTEHVKTKVTSLPDEKGDDD
jgi:DNA-binding protein HU-beta